MEGLQITQDLCLDPEDQILNWIYKNGSFQLQTNQFYHERCKNILTLHKHVEHGRKEKQQASILEP